MPTFVGSKEALTQAAALDTYTSENLFTTREYFTGDGIHGGYPLPFDTDGPRDVVLPTHSTITRNGTKTTDFFDDWYNRIHVIPSATDLGNLVSTQSREVSIWNAYLVPKPYTGINVEGSVGVTIQPPAGVTPPTTLAATQFVTYTVIINIAGPPSVDTTITYTIDGVEYTSTIVGRRVVLMPFPPNWRQGVDETLLYRSAGARAFDGTEQWASLRQKPRRVLSYTVLLAGKDAQQMDNLAYGWQGRLYGVPIWPEKALLNADAPAGALTLEVDTTNLSFAAGGLLAVYSGPQLNDVREIASIVGTTVTLTAPTNYPWPSGSKVYPVMVAAINATLSGMRHTDGVVEMPLSFESEPSSNAYPFDAGTAPLTYRSAEAYGEKINWADGMAFDWSTDSTKLDYQSGKFQLVSRSEYSDFTRNHSWLLEGKSEVADLRAFFQRRLGRATPLWMPSNLADFTLIAPVLIGANRLDVAANDYDIYSLNTNKRRDLFVRLSDGTTFMRRITGATREDEGTTALQLDSGVPVAFDQSTVTRISLMHFYRLTSDAVSLRWHTDNVASVNATFVTAKE